MNFYSLICSRLNRFSSWIIPVIPAILLTLLSCSGRDYDNTTSRGKVYYISPAGNDSNTGLQPEKAWQTIEKINASRFEPGDEILFEGGYTYNGTLSFHSNDAGTQDKRLTISSYGEKMAIINGGNHKALTADSCHYLSIQHLIFKGNGRKNGNDADGLLITNSDFFQADSLEISGFQHSGIHLHICNNARITYVYAHDNGFAGINVTGTTIWDTGRYDNHNLYIGYCIAGNNPGDPTVTNNHSGNGILASSVDQGVIEYCEAFNNGWDMPWKGNGPVGIWIWDSRNFTIQYCISHDNKTAPGAADGGGFDLDGGVSNSVIQYCLSYHNQGPGVGLYEFGAGKIWQNNTVRYTISQDDGIVNPGSLAIWRGDNGGTIRNCEIYNNTFYNSNSNGPNVTIMNNWPGFIFRNNIFVYHGSFLLQGKTIKDEVFQRNCYWNLTGDKRFLGYNDLRTWSTKAGKELLKGEFTGIYADPGLENPGKTKLTSPLLLKAGSFHDYRPRQGAPVIDAGLDLELLFGLDMGGKDLSGTAVPQGKTYDIGAIEFP